MISGASAIVVYLGVLAYAASRDLELAPVIGIVGGIGAVLLLFVIVRRAEDVLAWSILMLGVAYSLSLVTHRRGVDEVSPLVAGGLLLAAELATWSCGERRQIRVERRVRLARAVAVALLVVGGIGVSALVLALAAAPVGGGLGWTILGAASAVGVIGLATRLAR
ncbi:MAG TPA: hypothetical protein VGH82_12715 [Gaiellaceae bacterium]